MTGKTKTVGIIAAMKTEAERIISAMENTSVKIISGMVFTSGEISGVSRRRLRHRKGFCRGLCADDDT